jgi:uncharacterized protein YjbJ (UPF0337 family)
MNRDQLQGQWKQWTGKIKEKWGKLTDDDMTMIGGRWDQLVGKVQERYGYERDQAEKEVNDYMDNLWESEMPAGRRQRRDAA